MTQLVAVVGSANLDVIATASRRPEPGETILGTSYTEAPGGKGANQAIAAAGVGPTAMVGCIGTDAGGTLLVETLAAAGVDTQKVERSDAPTGRAIILLTPDGENSIVVLPGANSSLDPERVVVHLTDLKPDVVLTQLEVPLAVVEAIARWTADAGTRLVLNPSPARVLPAEILAAADPMILNTREAASILDDRVDAPAHELASRLAQLAASVVLTAGAEGAYVVSRGDITHIEGVPLLHVVDTTGAGDTFAGVLAGHLANGATLIEAAERANAEAARIIQLPRAHR